MVLYSYFMPFLVLTRHLLRFVNLVDMGHILVLILGFVFDDSTHKTESDHTNNYDH